jgi:hypothetical protein
MSPQHLGEPVTPKTFLLRQMGERVRAISYSRTVNTYLNADAPIGSLPEVFDPSAGLPPLLAYPTGWRKQKTKMTGYLKTNDEHVRSKWFELVPFVCSAGVSKAQVLASEVCHPV